MSRSLAFLAILPLLSLHAADAPKSVDTIEELRALAVDAPVASVDFDLSKGEREIEKVLWDRFANKPEETRFAGVTARDWKAKWDLLAKTLIAKAQKERLDDRSLGACLVALNKGLTKETAPVPIVEVPPLPSTKMIRRKDVTQVVENIPPVTSDPPPPSKEQVQPPPEADSQLGEPPDSGLDATIPVGAYAAHHSGDKWWIIVCKWEMAVPNAQLGHIRIWAVDAVTHKIVCFVGCD